MVILGVVPTVDVPFTRWPIRRFEKRRFEKRRAAPRVRPPFWICLSDRVSVVRRSVSSYRRPFEPGRAVAVRKVVSVENSALEYTLGWVVPDRSIRVSDERAHRS